MQLQLAKSVLVLVFYEAPSMVKKYPEKIKKEVKIVPCSQCSLIYVEIYSVNVFFLVSPPCTPDLRKRPDQV